jgi:hypothetical protein
MKRLCCALFLLLAGPAAADTTPRAAETGLPTANGLPIRVKAAVTFAEIESFSENNATFKATVDVRLRWQVLSLRRPAAEAADPPRVFRGAEAQAQLATLWVPNVELTNQRGSPTYTAFGLRIYPDGQVELTRRTTAEFATPHEVERFRSIARSFRSNSRSATGHRMWSRSASTSATSTPAGRPQGLTSKDGRCCT